MEADLTIEFNLQKGAVVCRALCKWNTDRLNKNSLPWSTQRQN